MTSFSALAIETENKPTIKEKNKSYIDQLYISVDCSKGLNSVTLKLFVSGGSIYLYRDSNSEMGTHFADHINNKENDEVLILDSGIYFQEYKVNRIIDFFLSTETLKKGTGEITAIIYNEFYSCDVVVN